MVLDREATRPGAGRVLNRVGVVLVALIAGALLPAAVIYTVGSRDTLPVSCRVGKPTPPSFDGTLVYARHSELWLAERDVNRSRKLVDLNPAPPPSPTPSAGASAAPGTPSPSISAATGAPGASPSPSPAAPVTEIVAAAISPDHHAVAFMVADPPGAPGTYSMRLVDPLNPGTPAGEAWKGPMVANGASVEVVALPEGRFLFKVPGKFDPPETSTRGVGVINPAAPDKLTQQATEGQFLSRFHSDWPETRGYRVPSQAPQLDDRVDGAGDVTAGRSTRQVATPLVRRTLQQLVLGKQGQADTRVLCGGADQFVPAAFSPDSHTLALTLGGSAYLLDVGGDHGATELFSGRVLDWRP